MAADPRREPTPGVTSWFVIVFSDTPPHFYLSHFDNYSMAQAAYEDAKAGWSEVFLCHVEAGPGMPAAPPPEVELVDIAPAVRRCGRHGIVGQILRDLARAQQD